MRACLLATTFAGGLLSTTPAWAQEVPFDSVVAFGDSLSDAGNASILFGAPIQLRFTTNPGRVAIEQVASHYGIVLLPSLSGGTDFAVGGTGIAVNNPAAPPGAPTVTAQVTSYLAANPSADPRALYSVWGGANEVLVNAAAVGSGLESPTQAGQGMAAAAQQELSLIGQLQAAGAKTIVVFNLPDVGVAAGPRAAGPAAQALYTALSSAFNDQLNSGLDTLKTGIVPVNVFAAIREVVASPQAYGFQNVTVPACTVDDAFLCTPATLVDPNAPSTFFFADGIHPTTAAHALLGQLVISELTAPGQMSLLPEAPLALARDHRAAIEKELTSDSASEGQGLRLFAAAGGGRPILDGDAQAPGLKSDDWLVTLGADWRWDPRTSAGAAVTFSESRSRFQRGGLGRFRTRGVEGSIFGQHRWGNGLWMSATAGYGGARLKDIERSFALGAALRTERSDGRARWAGAELAGGYWLAAGGVRTGPFASVSYDRVRVKRIQEKGTDSTAMWFASQTRTSTVAKVGWRVQGDWNAGGLALQPMATLAYAHDFDADRRDVTAGLVTMNGAFSLPGYLPAKNWGEASFGLGAALGDRLHGYVAYDARFGDGQHANEGSAGVSYAF